MRHARNFNPEWGYLAPAPSFLRTVRIALLAAAVGASAGAAVVFSLVERPAAEENSVAARTLPSADSTALSTPPAAQLQVATQEQRQSPQRQVRADVRGGSPAAAESSPSSTAQAPASIAALAEVPAATHATPAAGADETAAAPVHKKVTNKQHLTWRNTPRGEQAYGGTYGSSRGPLALLLSFAYSAVAGGQRSWDEY